MNKFRKLLKISKALIHKPALLGKVLEDNDHWLKYVDTKYNLETGLPVINPADITGDFSGQVTPFAFLDGSSLPTDLLLLRKLASTFQNCSYFEIGTWRGESVANVAPVADKCYTLNLSAQQMTLRNFPQKYINLHRFFSKDLKNITHLEGDSGDFDFDSLKMKFDLIFIDGDHHYEMVKNDTQKIFKHLVHPESVVIWHDYAYNPEKIRYEVLAGILDGTPEEFHQNIFHVNNTMCALFMRKKISSTKLESPISPANYFTITITNNSI